MSISSLASIQTQALSHSPRVHRAPVQDTSSQTQSSDQQQVQKAAEAERSVNLLV